MRGRRTDPRRADRGTAERAPSRRPACSRRNPPDRPPRRSRRSPRNRSHPPQRAGVPDHPADDRLHIGAGLQMKTITVPRSPATSANAWIRPSVPGRRNSGRASPGRPGGMISPWMRPPVLPPIRVRETALPRRSAPVPSWTAGARVVAREAATRRLSRRPAGEATPFRDSARRTDADQEPERRPTMSTCRRPRPTSSSGLIDRATARVAQESSAAAGTSATPMPRARSARAEFDEETKDQAFSLPRRARGPSWASPQSSSQTVSSTISTSSRHMSGAGSAAAC